jgi:hypothetical protein
LFERPRRKVREAMKPMSKVLGYIAVATVLALVFAMYARPDFVMTMANQVWGCF